MLEHKSDIRLILSMLFFVVSVTILGCGQNNLLQGLSKPEEHENTLESAQAYLDDGEYDKALSAANSFLRNHPDSDDAKAIKGQALLGKAGGGLTDILGNIGENKEVSSNFNALSIIRKANLDHLYAAADTLRSINDTDQNVRLAEGIACMLTAVAKVNWTFDPEDGILGNGSGGEPVGSANINATWATATTGLIVYTNAAAAAIASATGHDDLREVVTSVNNDISLVNAATSLSPVSYAQLLQFLGY